MLADPLTIASGFTLNPSVPAVSRNGSSSVYEKVVSNTRYTLKIAHQDTDKGRRRSTIRLDASRIVADPYVTTTNVQDTITAYLVIDRSTRLATDAEVLDVVEELIGGAALAASANVTPTRLSQVIAGES